MLREGDSHFTLFSLLTCCPPSPYLKPAIIKKLKQWEKDQSCLQTPCYPRALPAIGFWSLVLSRLLIKATFSTDICGTFVKIIRLQLNHTSVSVNVQYQLTFCFCPWKSNMFCVEQSLVTRHSLFNITGPVGSQNEKQREWDRLLWMCFLLVFPHHQKQKKHVSSFQDIWVFAGLAQYLIYCSLYQDCNRK